MVWLTIIFLSLTSANFYDESGIGSPCNYDEDCFIDHAFCEMQSICSCKKGFKPSKDNMQCLASVGAYCQSKYDCSTLPNSICAEDVCDCDRGYIMDSHGSLCLPVAKKYKSACNQTNQCSGLLGDQGFCSNNKTCECKSGSHHVNHRCYINAGLGEHCQNKSYCYINEKMVGRLDCIHNVCSCAKGYNRTGDMCGMAITTRFSWSVLASLLLVWALLGLNMQ